MKSSIDLTSNNDFRTDRIYGGAQKLRHRHKYVPWNKDCTLKDDNNIYLCENDDDLWYGDTRLRRNGSSSLTDTMIMYAMQNMSKQKDNLSESVKIKSIKDAHIKAYTFNKKKYVFNNFTYDKTYLTGKVMCSICHRYHRLTAFITNNDGIINLNKLYDHDNKIGRLYLYFSRDNHTSVRKRLSEINQVACFYNTKNNQRKGNAEYYKNKRRHLHSSSMRNCLDYYDKYEFKVDNDYSYYDIRRYFTRKYVYYKGKGQESFSRNEELFQPHGRVPQEYDKLFDDINWREMLAKRLGEEYIESPSDNERRRPDFADPITMYNIIRRPQWSPISTTNTGNSIISVNIENEVLQYTFNNGNGFITTHANSNSIPNSFIDRFASLDNLTNEFEFL